MNKKKKKLSLVEARVERNKEGFKLFVRSPSLEEAVQGLALQTDGKPRKLTIPETTSTAYAIKGSSYNTVRDDIIERVNKRGNVSINSNDVFWDAGYYLIDGNRINLAHLVPVGCSKGVSVEYKMPTTNSLLKKITELVHCTAVTLVKEHHRGFRGEVNLFIEEGTT